MMHITNSKPGGASDYYRQHGIKSLKELSKLSGVPAPTLDNIFQCVGFLGKFLREKGLEE